MCFCQRVSSAEFSKDLYQLDRRRLSFYDLQGNDCNGNPRGLIKKFIIHKTE